jgi:hypothetical protein
VFIVTFQQFFIYNMTTRFIGFMVMVFHATLNNISFISWQSVVLVEGIGVPGETHRPVASH